MKLRVTRLLAAALSVLLFSLNPAAPKAAGADSAFAGPEQLGVDEDTDESLITRYEPAAETGALKLYADFASGLFAVQDKASGSIWYSTPNDSQLDEKTRGLEKMAVRSQVIIQYLYESDITSALIPAQANSQLACVANGSVTVEKIADGLRVVYDFKEYGIVIPVSYTLGDGYLDVCVEAKEIKETADARLVSINVLPSFGAGGEKDSGYLFVPDGSGALIHLNNGREAGVYEQPVYGPDAAVTTVMKTAVSEKIRMPVFGAAVGNQAFLGIITEGEAQANILAANANGARAYNTVSSRLTLRRLTEKSIFERDGANNRRIGRLTEKAGSVSRYRLRYYLLAGGAANYSKMAETYRAYLIAGQGLSKRVTAPALNVDFVGAVQTPASFLGIPYRKTIALTPFAKAREILEKLKAEGVGGLSARYLGWGGSGAGNRRLPGSAAPLAALGGRKGLGALEGYAKETGIPLYPETDLIRFETGSKSKAIRDAFHETSLEYRHLRSVYAPKLTSKGFMLLTPGAILRQAEKFADSYERLGMRGVALSTLGQYVYSDYSPERFADRNTAAGQMLAALRAFTGRKLSVALDDANLYAALYADKILAAPASSSGYRMFDREIPFYQMVLHGYISTVSPPLVQTTDPREAYLKAVESGSELLFTGTYHSSVSLSATLYDQYYSAEYTLWIADAAQKYREWMPLYKKIYDQPIVRHEEIIPDVIRVTYQNGVSIVVNYLDEAVTADGVAVAPRGFAETRGGTGA